MSLGIVVGTANPVLAEGIAPTRNRPVVIVDDVSSTVANIEAAVDALRAHRAAGEPIVVATHGLSVVTWPGSGMRDRPGGGHRQHHAASNNATCRARALHPCDRQGLEALLQGHGSAGDTGAVNADC
jgi:hypothetical protein